MSDATAGEDWTDHQNDLVVADYFSMLTASASGIQFVKLHRYKDLADLIGKSYKAVERKHQNISAVVEKVGLHWLAGLAPLRNYQASLIAAVDRYLSANPGLTGQFATVESSGLVRDVDQSWLAPPRTITFTAPPTLTADDAKSTDALDRLVRKFDPVLRDARNRKLGYDGEELIFQFERERLRAAGRSDLASKVEWTSQERGDGAGYDIASFDERGAERFIEVKTTQGPAKTPFFLSENERAFSDERADAFRLVRLHDFTAQPHAFELKPPLTDFILLQPMSYRAELR